MPCLKDWDFYLSLHFAHAIFMYQAHPIYAHVHGGLFSLSACLHPDICAYAWWVHGQMGCLFYRVAQGTMHRSRYPVNEDGRSGTDTNI